MSLEPGRPATRRLRYVACVSYPRSGHHLTVRLLHHYFGQEFNYCQYYEKDESVCCQTFPCTSQCVTMTKNHDMELGNPHKSGLPKVEGVPYLILIRNFLEAAVSDYNLFLRSHPEDTREAWEQFSRRRVLYYKRFLNKWVISNDGLEKLVVRYEELTGEPHRVFSQIVQFFDPSHAIQTDRLTRIVSEAVLEDVKPETTEVIRNFGVKNRRRLEDFAYFDAGFFCELEQCLEPEFEQLGYPIRFAA